MDVLAEVVPEDAVNECVVAGPDIVELVVALEEGTPLLVVPLEVGTKCVEELLWWVLDEDCALLTEVEKLDDRELTPDEEAVGEVVVAPWLLTEVEL